MLIDMSSPIHHCYRYVSPRHTNTASESAKPGLINTIEERSAGILINDLQPQPLAAAMYSIQLMADVVNRALHQCTSQEPKNAAMTNIEFDSREAPSFCYFFIDMQPQSGNDYNYSDYNLESCQNCTNILNKQNLSSNSSTPDASILKVQRQRSISECSDDSFICFEDDNNSIDSVAFGCSDCNATDKISEVNNESQGLRKQVRFNLKPKVHVMHAWDFAYRAARKGDWQEMALDRSRFQQRIARIAPILNKVLTSKHREKVYTDRF